MNRISSAGTKLTKDSMPTKKLNLCQAHFSRASVVALLIVSVFTVCGTSMAQEDALSDDEFEQQIKEPAVEKPAQNPAVENTELFDDKELIENNEPPAVTEAEPQTEVAPPAEDLVEVRGGDLPLVEVKQQYSTEIPYKERREKFGWVFSVGSENLFMSEYISLLDANYYEDLFGEEDLTFFQVELGLKYNFKLGGIELSAGYGMGSVTDNRIGDDRKLEISKPFLGLTLYLDTIMKEPYVVPYFGAQIWTMDIKEVAVTSDIEDAITTDIGFSYKIGLLFQLNWLDRDSAQTGYQDHHIQNTYLDVFVAQNAGTQGEEDPDTSSDFNWGAGLKIEF